MITNTQSSRTLRTIAGNTPAPRRKRPASSILLALGSLAILAGVGALAFAPSRVTLPAATLPPTGGVQQGDSNNETPTALAETPVATAEDSPDGTATAIVALDEAIPCPARMEIGQTARCSIDQPAEVDVYRLTITKTQHLQIRLASSVESIWTGVKVIDSQGNTICQQSKAVSAEIADCELQPGDYGIFIQDAYNGTRTGEYHLHITSLNDLTAATPITFQQTLVGEIKYPAEVDRFVFTAHAGAKVRLGVSGSVSSIWPRIRLFQMDNATPICEATKAVSVAVECTLPADSEYLFQVSDGYNMTRTGKYQANLTCLLLDCE